ncbi:MAG: sigma-54 dependent transcriptional regulator [Myxococcota bacterium]
MPGRVLIVDDDDALCATLVRALGRRGFAVTAHPRVDGALDHLVDHDVDVVVVDLHLPDASGIDVARRVHERRPTTPVVVLTAFGSLDAAVEAIRAGAYDFLSKPIEVDALALALDRAIDHRRLTDELHRLRGPRAERPAWLGDSPPIRALEAVVDRVAPTGLNVVVHGESGTGKELVARALHDRSPRAAGPFVPINCAAVPEALLESELFGHVRGAFTDARGARAGLFVRASGGTLFLDEVGDLSPGLQARLLRAVQERRIRPVGSDDEVAVDVRIVAATHRDLDALVAAGAFRADLLYRLDGVRVEVPPLRDRGTDVLALAQRFVDECARRTGRPVTGIAPPTARKLLDHDWPGNVRELQHCIERAVALTAFDRLTVDDLPPRIAEARPPAPAERSGHDAGDDSLLSLAEVERRHVARVLAAVDGNKARAARILGVDRKTLYRMLAHRDAGSGEDG